MKLSALFLLLAVFCVPSLQASAEESVPENLKILGQGIQNKLNKEILLLACVGQEVQEENGINCAKLRLIRIEKNSTPVWLGSAFSPGNLYSISDEYQKVYESSFPHGFLNLFRGKNSKAMTRQEGWNWATQAFPIDDDEYQRLIMISLYFSNYKKSVLPTVGDFKVGDEVVKDSDPTKLYRIEKVSGGECKLSDGERFHYTDLSHTLSDVGGFVAGSVVYKTLMKGDLGYPSEIPKSFIPVKGFRLKAITEKGKFVLTDNYGQPDVLESNSNIYSKEELAKEIYLQIIFINISTNGTASYKPYFFSGYTSDHQYAVVGEKNFLDEINYFVVPKAITLNPVAASHGFKIGDSVREKGCKLNDLNSRCKLKIVAMGESGSQTAFVFDIGWIPGLTADKLEFAQ